MANFFKILAIMSLQIMAKKKTYDWTPKGDCKVMGNEERKQLQFYEVQPFQRQMGHFLTDMR